MIILNYYLHLLLTSRYLPIINSFIIFMVYITMREGHSTFCMNETTIPEIAEPKAPVIRGTQKLTPLQAEVSEFLGVANTLNKTSILSYLFNLYKDLTLYLEENKKLLSRKEKSYINALRNFILQLRRYFKIQSGKEFSNIVNTLQDKELLLGIEKLSKEKKISKEITLLSKPFIFDYKVAQPSKKGKNPFKK